MKLNENDVTDLKSIYKVANKTFDYPQKLNLHLDKNMDLRYGENPNQPGALYKFDSEFSITTNLKQIKSGKGGMSGANLMDINRAIEILKFFEKPSVAVMKHCIPSGFATTYTDESLVNLYKKARDADTRSAFGCVTVFNTKVDIDTANEIMTSFVEVVAAPSFDEKAFEILSKKESMRIITFENLDKLPKFEGDDVKGLFDLKVMPVGGIIVQTPFLTRIRSRKELVKTPSLKTKDGSIISVKRAPTEKEYDDLLASWYINLGVRSNGIIIIKDGVTLAVGSGQQERVGAVEQAIIKAYQKAMDRAGIIYDPLNVMQSISKLGYNPLDGAILSSDGFFPFRDSIDLLAKVGIKAIIQPGGSIKDDEVIVAANEHNMAMVFTKERCFGHF